MKEMIESYFAKLDDPHSARNQRRRFTTLIGTSLLTTLCGIDSFSGIQDFVEMHMQKLQEYFNFLSQAMIPNSACGTPFLPANSGCFFLIFWLI